MASPATAVLDAPSAVERAHPVAAPPLQEAGWLLRGAQTLHILDAIVHVLDHHTRDHPVLSEVKLPLDTEPRLARYFTELIENVLRHAETAEVSFARQDHQVAVSCRMAMKRPAAFVKESRTLAEALWKATASNRSISPGSLIVCRFRAEKSGPALLALLKVDPTQVLLQTIKGPAGKETLLITLADNALTTAKERLQKAALVTPQGYAKRFDLLLLDRLVAGPAALFFAQGFLGIKAVPTPREQTDQLHKAYLTVKTALTRELGPAAQPIIDRLEATEADLLRQPAVDAYASLPGLDLPEAVKDQLKEALDEGLSSPTVVIDPRFAATILGDVCRIRGDSKVLIEFDREFGKTGFHQGATVTRPDGSAVTTITLDVPNLRWAR
jgi:37-kD nucleoid-associated bacterial protein